MRRFIEKDEQSGKYIMRLQGEGPSCSAMVETTTVFFSDDLPVNNIAQVLSSMYLDTSIADKDFMLEVIIALNQLEIFYSKRIPILKMKVSPYTITTLLSFDFRADVALPWPGVKYAIAKGDPGSNGSSMILASIPDGQSLCICSLNAGYAIDVTYSNKSGRLLVNNLIDDLVSVFEN